MSAYEYVRGILSSSTLNGLKDEIKSFFEEEYPSKEVADQYVASRGQRFGVRYLGYYTLEEIVGEPRYQPYYSDYKAVFLLDSNKEVTIAGEARTNFTDLTNKDILKRSILVPPTDASLQNLGRGTEIHTEDGSNFNRPIRVNRDTRIPLTLYRDGFQDIRFEVDVTSERQDVNLPNVTWKKEISLSMFDVRNQEQEKLDKDISVSVNGTDITFRAVLFSEEDCRQAEVKVSAIDYETFEQTKNLLNGDCEIVLSRKDKVFQAQVELANGRLAEMTIKSRHLYSTDKSPLKGYDYDWDYCLRMSSRFVWKQRLWGFLGGLGVVVLIVLSLMIDSWIDNGNLKPIMDGKETQTAETPAVVGFDEQSTQETEISNGAAEPNGEQISGIYEVLYQD